MKLSRVVVYLGILVALGAYVYFAEIKGKQAKQQAEEKASRIVKLEKGDIDEIDLQSKEHGKIQLKKLNDIWLLDQPVKSKADQAAVVTLLTSAVEAQPEKVLAEKDVKWTEYGLDNPGLLVTLRTKDKDVSILFGESNPVKTSYYLRTEGDPRLFLVADTLKNSLNKSTLALRSKTVVAISPDDVDRLVVTLEGQEEEFRRRSPDEWVMEKPRQFKVKGLAMARNLNALTNLSAKDIIDEPKKEGDPYGLDKPEGAILLGGEKLTLKLLVGGAVTKEGAPPGPDSDRYARIEGQDLVYVLDGRSLKDIVLDPEKLRDKSVLGFKVAEAEKLEIELDGKSWLLIQDKDKRWTLEKPEKKPVTDSLTVTSLLWDLRDLEWKSLTTPIPADLTGVHLDKPNLILSLFLKGREKPIVLKAGWAPTAPKVAEGESTGPKRQAAVPLPGETTGQAEEQTPPAQKTPRPALEKTQLPETVNALVEPHEEAGLFVLDGKFVERLRNELLELSVAGK